MEKFLIINPFGIGDCLFTTPVIRALKERYPHCSIGYWCNERVGGLLRSDPDIDKIFALSRGDIKKAYKGPRRIIALLNLIGKIKKEDFDAAFDFSLDSRYGLWSKFAGIKRRIGFNYKNRGRFLTEKIGLDCYSGRHVVEYNLELLRFIGIESFCPGLKYSITVSKENSAKAKNVLAENGIAQSGLIIGIVPGGGASWGKDAAYKQWPAEKFAELAERLKRDPGVGVVLLGSAEEKGLVEKMGKIGALPKAGGSCFSHIVNLTGKLSIEELAAIIKELKVLVCNDGGPLHMAIALGIKTVSIFGPVDEKVYGPYPPGPDHVVVKNDLSCRPCYRNFRFNGCSNDRKCLDGITVEEVYEKVKTLL